MGPQASLPSSVTKKICTTCLERVLNIFYCSLIIAFQHYYLNAASFMGSAKIPFTSSQEQSGNLECDVSRHPCSCPASLLPFGSFMRPDSLASFCHMILIDLCAARMALLCVMLVSIVFPDNDFQKGIPLTVTSIFFIADVYRICHCLADILCLLSDCRKSRVLGVTTQA